MLTTPPVDVRYAGITYRVEPEGATGNGASFVVARPLDAAGTVSVLNPAQHLSLDLPDARAAWANGFAVNDSYFIPLSLVAVLLENRHGVKIEPAPIWPTQF